MAHDRRCRYFVTQVSKKLVVGTWEALGDDLSLRCVCLNRDGTKYVRSFSSNRTAE
jgi:hypothetical protein